MWTRSNDTEPNESGCGHHRNYFTVAPAKRATRQTCKFDRTAMPWRPSRAETRGEPQPQPRPEPGRSAMRRDLAPGPSLKYWFCGR